MNKKAIRFPAICLLLSLLTGCYPSGELNSSSEPAVNSTENSTPSDIPDNSNVSQPAAFTMPNDLKNVKFTFELGNNYPSEAPVIKAKKRIFDVEEMKKMFIDGKTVIRETSNDGLNVFQTSDGETLVVDKGRVDYSVDHILDDEEKHNIYDIQSTAVTNLRFFYLQYPHIDRELQGFPRSEAIERAEELLKKLEIKYLGEPKIYTFTSEDVINAFGETSLDIEGNEVNNYLPKEDEFYLVRYLGEYNGIPMPSEVGPIEDEFQYNEQVDIILTKDSLVSIECKNIFDSIETVDTTKVKCSAETAVSNTYDYYRIKDPTLKYQFEYESMGISYITYEIDRNMGECVFKPLWHMSGTRHYEDPDGYVGRKDIDKCIDPVTGYVYDGGDWA